MGQRAQISRRLLQMIPTIFVLVFLVFMMIHLIPGDPALTMLGIEATPEKVQELHRHLGLDKPLIVQLGIYAGNLAHGDLGTSLLVRVPVLDLVRQRLPMTLFLVAYAMALALLMTLPLALLAALKKQLS